MLAQPPFHVLAGAFAGLVPLLVWVAGLPAGAAGRAAAVRGGYLFGAVYHALLLYWVAIALVPRIGIAVVPVFLLLLLVLASFGALFTTTLHFIAGRRLLPLALAAALCWTAVEWLQGHLGPASFPWLGLGGTLAEFPRLAGGADLVGVRGLGFWLALVNGLVATVVLRHRARRSVVPVLIATLAAVLIPAGYGFWRANSLRTVPVAQVALIQTNAEPIPDPEGVRDAVRSQAPDAAADIDPEGTRNALRREAVEASLNDLVELTSGVAAGSVDLVVWPEVAVPVPLDGEEFGYLRDRIARLATELKTPILVGAYGGSPDRAGDSGPAPLTNSAFLIRPGAGTAAAYHKRRLVPFVERGLLPWRLDPGVRMGDRRYFGLLRPGTTAPLLEHGVAGAQRSTTDSGAAGTAAFGVLICFESIFPGLSREYRRAGADYLVNITSDAWYGSGEWYGRTTGLWQHPAHLVFRAIETRSGVVRAANSGFSFAVDPVGRVYERSNVFGASARAVSVRSNPGRTVYAQSGDILGTGSALALSLLLLLGWVRTAGRSG